MTHGLIRRLDSEPLIAPGAVPGYGPIFNAGLIHHEGRYHLFARGVRDGYRRNPGFGPRFLDYRSDVLLFVSADGRRYSFQKVLAAGGSTPVFSYEDPRIQPVQSGGRRQVMMTYTDLPDPNTGLPWRIGLHRLVYRVGAFHLNRTSGRVVGPPGVPDKDAVLFNLSDGRLALLHRIQPNIQLAVFDSLEQLSAPDPTYWREHLAHLEDHVILRPTPGALGVGAGPAPITTEAGLLLFFHERRADGAYTMRVALLDPGTGRTLSELPDPILEPELPWEVNGDVDRVVFVQGAHRRSDGTIYLTYGAADRAVGAAVVSESALLAALSA